jgi:hypothetical protein
MVSTNCSLTNRSGEMNSSNQEDQVTTHSPEDVVASGNKSTHETTDHSQYSSTDNDTPIREEEKSRSASAPPPPSPKEQLTELENDDFRKLLWLEIIRELNQYGKQVHQSNRDSFNEHYASFGNVVHQELLNQQNLHTQKLDERFAEFSGQIKNLEEEYEAKKRECDASLQKLEEDRILLKVKEQALDIKKAEQDTKQTDLDTLDRETESKMEANQKLQKQNENKESELKTLEQEAKAKLAEAEKIKNTAEDLEKESKKIHDSFIPDFLAKTSLALKQVLVEKEDEDETRNMLIAHLHLIRHAFGFAKEDDSYLKRNLSETGRFLFSFLKERDLTSEDAIEWKEMINEKLTEQGVEVELRIPEIGEPYEQRWMQVSGSSTGDRVDQVVNWGVMTSEGIRIHKAEVKV